VAGIKARKFKSMREVKKAAKSRGGGGQYLKRTPSEGSISVRFLDEPTGWVEYVEHYEETHEPRYFPCVDPVSNCPGNHGQGDGRASKRWLAPAIDLESNQVVPLVLPVSAVDVLLARYDKFGTLLDRDYEIAKTGSGFDTKYDVDYEPATKKNLAKYEVPDLYAILEAQLGSDEDDEDEFDEDFDEEDEPPRKRPVRRGGPIKKNIKRRRPVEDTDDDEDDDEEEARPIRRSKAPAKRPVRTTGKTLKRAR
jgi:hypothetical protein